MKIEDIISKHIGDLTIELAKLRLIVQQQAEEIQRLKAEAKPEPELDFTAAKKSNGKSKPIDQIQ